MSDPQLRLALALGSLVLAAVEVIRSRGNSLAAWAAGLLALALTLTWWDGGAA